MAKRKMKRSAPAVADSNLPALPDDVPTAKALDKYSDEHLAHLYLWMAKTRIAGAAWKDIAKTLGVQPNAISGIRNRDVQLWNRQWEDALRQFSLEDITAVAFKHDLALVRMGTTILEQAAGDCEKLTTTQLKVMDMARRSSDGLKAWAGDLLRAKMDINLTVRQENSADEHVLRDIKDSLNEIAGLARRRARSLEAAAGLEDDDGAGNPPVIDAEYAVAGADLGGNPGV